jgi:two-component system, NarL family, sensor histidine kinase UhpB
MTAAQAQGILAKAIPEAVWDTNLITGKTYTNDALLAMFGYTAEEAANNDWWWSSNLHPADRERVEGGIAEALESDASEWTDIYRFRCSNGQYKTIVDRSTIIRSGEGIPVRLVGTMLDITERMEKEAALTEALRRYNVLMQATQDAIWDMNLLTGETYTNDTLQQLFGYDEELRDNETWWNTNLHPEDKDRVVKGITEALAGNTLVWKDEYRFRCKNGSYKIVLDRSSIIRNEKGQPIRLIGAMQDITSERILQQALTAQAIVKHQKTAQEILQVQEQEKQLLGDELHENISQVLATVKLFVDHALQNERDREAMLKESSGYLRAVIDEIRKLHRDLVPLPLETFTLLDLIQQEADKMQRVYGIDMEVKFSKINENLLDRELKLSIFRIVQEQLENIRRHSKAMAASVRLAQKGDQLMLTIADNGIGIDRNDMEQRIGLKSIFSRVQVFNGACNIDTQKNNGFRLVVTIPTAQ